MPTDEPAAATADLLPDLGANREGARRDEFLSVSVLAAQARLVAADLGITMSGSRIRALVRAFIHEGHALSDFRSWFLAYADPTGETAVRRVMRENDDESRT